MSVWKNRGTWRYRILRDGIVVAGSARTREEALALEGRARTDLIDKRIGAAPRHTLPEAFAKYFSSAEALNLKSIGSLVDKAGHWTPFIEGRRITEAADAADHAMSAWHANGLKAATINRRLALLRRILNLAYRRWEWLQQPMADKIELLSGEESRQVYLDRAQGVVLRRKMKLGEPRAWVSLLLATGLRAGELERLQADQIISAVVRLNARTKSGKPRASPILHFGLRYIKYLPLKLRYQGVRMHFEKARVEIGMPHLRLHDLRHTTASWLIQDGKATLRDIQEWFGHSSPTMSARYAHLEVEHLERVARRLRAGDDEKRSKRRNSKALTE